jgi:hypothetical protein
MHISLLASLLLLAHSLSTAQISVDKLATMFYEHLVEILKRNDSHIPHLPGASPPLFCGKQLHNHHKQAAMLKDIHSPWLSLPS